MGVYYYLANDTKKERVHYDDHVKCGPIRFNEALHMAFVNYMFENIEDSMRLVSDLRDMGEVYEYREIDLSTYNYDDKEIGQLIKAKQQKIMEEHKSQQNKTNSSDLRNIAKSLLRKIKRVFWFYHC
jgi:hypothetical protein